jgi:hypothetical protein
LRDFTTKDEKTVHVDGVPAQSEAVPSLSENFGVADADDWPLSAAAWVRPPYACV